MHFSGEKAVFEAGRGKNPNFREVKRGGEKRRFGAYESDYCRNWCNAGENKGVFARFHYQSKQKMNANFVSKLWLRHV